jgi:hypothetical protein
MVGWLAGCVLVAPLAAPIEARCAEPLKKPAAVIKTPLPDLKFLEYLGTLEDDDENWTDVAVLVQASSQPDGQTTGAQTVNAGSSSAVVPAAGSGSKAKSDTAAKSAAEKK